MKLSFIIPTYQRPSELAETLERLSASGAARSGDEVIVVDNASNPRAEVPGKLVCGTPVHLIRESGNRGAAARNTAADSATGDWLVMLDDDSNPTTTLATVLEEAPQGLAAIGGEILLPSGRREAGGLPEVIIGCGCAIRRKAFLGVGGYDPSFNYYVEEYDLCAKLVGAGWRIAHTRAIGFEHRKTESGRDFGRILSRLVRNNAWTITRYAPQRELESSLESMFERYCRISIKENVESSFEAAVDEARETIPDQPRRPLNQDRWDRFIGASAVRSSLVPSLRARGIERVSLVARGKGDEIVERTLIEDGISIEPESACSVIGTLSPGPMLDARAADAISPYELWSPDQPARTEANRSSTPATTRS